jgi:hypothetical protein
MTWRGMPLHIVLSLPFQHGEEGMPLHTGLLPFQHNEEGTPLHIVYSLCHFDTARGICPNTLRYRGGAIPLYGII